MFAIQVNWNANSKHNGRVLGLILNMKGVYYNVYVVGLKEHIILQCAL